MPVFRWGHTWGDAFADLEREVDRMLSNVNMTVQGLRFGRQYPPINLFELPEEFLITSEIPGVRSEDLDLTIAGGVLTIRCKRQEEAPPAETNYRRQERPKGVWLRSISIPDRVSEDGLKAELINGILKIHLPKAPLDQPRQIQVVGD